MECKIKQVTIGVLRHGPGDRCEACHWLGKWAPKESVGRFKVLSGKVAALCDEHRAAYAR